MRGGIAAPEPIPVFVPDLPRAPALLPYLERIDGARRYSNRGDLVCALEDRLREVLRLGEARVVCAASGTAALQAAILAAAGRAGDARPVALVQAHSFVATAFAAEACGYRVVFADVAEGGWALCPDGLRAHPALVRAGVVVPAAPYGMPHDQAGWARFAAETCVPVVIDAAASFDALCRDATLAGPVPIALSFHATKSFATGEGGAVIWSDTDGLARVAQAINFGFLGTRSARSPGLNGKMSEYHAAVGLAGLDAWEATEARRAAVVARYRAEAPTLLLPPDVGGTYALHVAVTDAAARRAAVRLAADAIEYRFWYGRGIHREPYFAADAVGLPRTEALAARVLGVPLHDGLSVAHMARVAAAVAG